MEDLKRYSMAALAELADEAELKISALGVPLPADIEEKYSAFLATRRSEQQRSLKRGNVDPDARAATLRAWSDLEEALSGLARCKALGDP